MLKRSGKALFTVRVDQPWFQPSVKSGCQSMRSIFQHADRLRYLNMVFNSLTHLTLTDCERSGVDLNPPILDTFIIRFPPDGGTAAFINILELPINPFSVRKLVISGNSDVFHRPSSRDESPELDTP